MDKKVDRNKRAEVKMRKKVVDDILQSVPDYIQRVKCDTIPGIEPFKCAVPSCRNVFETYDQNSSYKFHNFPQNSLLDEWRERCKMNKDVDVTLIKVCSDHFTPDDYKRDFKGELTDASFRRELKITAVPSQMLNGPEIRSHDCGSVTLSADFKEEVTKVVDRHEYLKEKCLKLVQEKLELEESVRQLNSKLVSKRRRFKYVTQNFRKLQPKNNEVSEKRSLLRIFSQSQLNVLLGKKKVVWTDDDMAMAFTLRHMGSRQCYLYLKNRLKLPLPSLGSIQKWAASK